MVHNGKKTCSGKIPEPKKDENLILDLLGYYDIKEVITDIARGEADLDTLKAGASLIPVAKITKVPKVVKAIGNVGKTGFKKGKEGEKTVWKRFTREDQPKPDKNKGNQSKTGSKSGTTTSKPNQEEASKSGQAKQTKAKNKGGSGTTTGDNSKILSNNLVREGRPVGEGEAAAHIVASTSSKRQWELAADSRKLLDKYDIDINNAANGIPLGNPRPHNLTHNRAFHEKVSSRLRSIETNIAK